jgi:hypothetical protein
MCSSLAALGAVCRAAVPEHKRHPRLSLAGLDRAFCVMDAGIHITMVIRSSLSISVSSHIFCGQVNAPELLARNREWEILGFSEFSAIQCNQVQ